MWNSMFAGGITGAVLAMRQGPAPAMVSGAIGSFQLNLFKQLKNKNCI